MAKEYLVRNERDDEKIIAIHTNNAAIEAWEKKPEHERSKVAPLPTIDHVALGSAKRREDSLPPEVKLDAKDWETILKTNKVVQGWLAAGEISAYPLG